MAQYQVRIMNYPDPSSEELYVRKACEAYAQARAWAEQAGVAGLEDLLFPSDRPALQQLIADARSRRLLSTDGRDAVAGLAAACAARIARLVDPDSSGTRARARTLSGNEVELHALVTAIDEVLDLEHALDERHRIAR
jgi:hypothetical protein